MGPAEVAGRIAAGAYLAVLRPALADALAARGHGNPEFLRQIRDGEQDDGPFMVGAIVGLTVGLQIQGET